MCSSFFWVIMQRVLFLRASEVPMTKLVLCVAKCLPVFFWLRKCQYFPLLFYLFTVARAKKNDKNGIMR